MSSSSSFCPPPIGSDNDFRTLFTHLRYYGTINACASTATPIIREHTGALARERETRSYLLSLEPLVPGARRRINRERISAFVSPIQATPPPSAGRGERGPREEEGRRILPSLLRKRARLHHAVSLFLTLPGPFPFLFSSLVPSVRSLSDPRRT